MEIRFIGVNGILLPCVAATIEVQQEENRLLPLGYTPVYITREIKPKITLITAKGVEIILNSQILTLEPQRKLYSLFGAQVESFRYLSKREWLELDFLNQDLTKLPIS